MAVREDMLSFYTQRILDAAPLIESCAQLPDREHTCKHTMHAHCVRMRCVSEPVFAKIWIRNPS